MSYGCAAPAYTVQPDTRTETYAARAHLTCRHNYVRSGNPAGRRPTLTAVSAAPYGDCLVALGGVMYGGYRGAISDLRVFIVPGGAGPGHGTGAARIQPALSALSALVLGCGQSQACADGPSRTMAPARRGEVGRWGRLDERDLDTPAADDQHLLRHGPRRPRHAAGLPHRYLRESPACLRESPRAAPAPASGQADDESLRHRSGSAHYAPATTDAC